MGQRHNRRRSRGRLNPNKFIKSHYKHEAIEARDMVEHDEAFPLYRNLSSLQARHWRQRYVQWQDREQEHRTKAEALEAEQRRVFGGEVGDEDLVALGLLHGDEEQDNTEHKSPVIEAPIPTFRSRSCLPSTWQVSCGEDPKDKRTDDDDWDIVSSAASDSGPDAWELLSDDS